MNNDIERREKLSYLAGIIDGEGTIDIGGGSTGNSSIRLWVANTNLQLMDWLEHNYSGTVKPMSDKRSNQKGRKPVFRWYIYGREAYKMIKHIRIYLLIKQKQADVCIGMYEKVTRHHFQPRPLWAKEYQEECKREILRLNKRGLNNEQN